MPKKVTKYVQVQESASSTTAVVGDTSKCHRSVLIGPRNGRRWLSLKKRLGLLTDDDLIVYLLDLADSISVRKDENCIENAGSWKMACTQKKETLTITDTKSSLNIFHMEVPRRSLRKLATSDEISKNEKSEKIERLANISNNLDTAQSDLKLYSKSCSRINKIKRHKNKARHHKDKRKKKRHQKTKDLKDIINIENKETRNIPWEFDSGSDAEKISADMPENYISSTTVQQTLKNSNSLDSKTILTLQKSSYNLNEEMCSDINKTDKSIDNFADATCNERELKIKTVQNYSTQILEVKNNSNKHNKEIIKMNLLKPDKVSIIHSQFSSNKKCLENVEYLNKKNKHPKLKSSESCKVLIELDKDYSDELSSLNKHDKKRHKADNQQNKKQDVRKAPQDGIIITKDNQDFVSCSNDLSMTPIIHNVPDNNILPSEVITENNEVETQKLAIKIKLCQICNTRHLQDICPLMEPKYIISDSVSLEKWIQKYNKNCEVMKAVDSNDPMCKGYHKNINNGFESEEELSEQFKSKMKKESEEKLQTVDINRPLYAQDSLPDCLELKLSNVDHGLGVFVKSFIPMHTQLGPLIGKTVQEMDIPDDFSMRHIWEVNMNEKKLYISTTNPLISNWIRYIRPAETKDNRNVIVISKNGSLFLVTSKNLIAGTELIYWLDSHSTIWSRKNKIDKTNCGGCNLNFLHPIYYRLHCSIFHDTNYSLTIRKYHCKVCGAAVLGKDNIMKHAAQLHAGRGAYQCQYCKKFFLRLNYLEMHRTYGCSQNPQRSRPLCDFCGRKFCQPQKLKVHIKRMHSDMSEVLREFQCKLCLKLLGSRAALQRHMKEVHHKDVIGAATCDRCGKMFQNKSNLKIHMLTHSGVKPFKCKENGCKAAFTTKQCLQFHYKKVHGLSEDMMPKIERSVAYTFDAYSGGLVEDAGRGKTPKFNSSNTQENSNSLASFDDCSSENNNTPSITDIHNNDTSDKFKETKKLNQHTTAALTTADSSVESIESDGDLYGTSHLPNKSDKKWLGEFNPTSSSPLPTTTTTGIYDFHDNKREEKIQLTNESLIDNSKLNSNLYRKTESASASLLVEAALDAAEREIGAVSSPILEDSDRETNIYSITNELDFKTSCPQNQVIQRSPETHIDSYVQDDLTTSPTLHTRNTPSNHMYLDFHVHRSVDYVNPVNKNHSIDQYLEQQDIQRIIHNSQEVLTSPTRYQEISHSHFHSHSHIYPHSHHQHHQITNDEISSDEGDSVAQNLSLSVKEKNLQHLELIKYDTLESEFGSINRERVRFEPLIVQTVGDQGLDMSARGFQQSFGSQVQNSNIHSHHQHLYEINERERQGVDLSRTSTCISPPQYSLPPYSPYSQVDVSRVVSLEPTRSHSLHNSRIIASPQPTNSLTSHLVSDNLETRTLSSPPPSMPVYNSAYTIGSTSYHSSRSGYHYSGYYQ